MRIKRRRMALGALMSAVVAAVAGIPGAGQEGSEPTSPRMGRFSGLAGAPAAGGGIRIDPLTGRPTFGATDSPPPRPSTPASASAAGGGTAIRLKGDEAEGVSRPGEDRQLQVEIRGLDIHEALKIFSRQAGVNIVAGGNVRGKVTAYLKGVPLWEALEAVLESENLTYVRKGDVIAVITAQEYEQFYGVKIGAERTMEVVRLNFLKPEPVAQFLQSLKTGQGEILFAEWGNALVLIDTPRGVSVMKKAVEELDIAPVTKVFELSYADLKDIVKQVAPLVSKLQGDIKVDEAAGRFFVRDSPKRVEEISRVVEAFDVPHRGVLIEAKIVQVELSDDFQFGINWEYIFKSINGKNVGGTVKGLLTILPVGTQNASDAKTKGTVATIGQLAQNEFTATLELLKSVGKTELLSSPRIAALHGKEAKILVGTKEAYVTTTVVTPGGGGATVTSEQVTFVDVGVKLYVTPFIGEDGSVTMKIQPEVSSVNKTITTSGGNSVPVIRTSQVDTQVTVPDGTTLVIGGLIEDRKEAKRNRVPFLGAIPLIGRFFSSESESIRKTELVVFLTPRILKQSDFVKEARRL